MNPLISVIVPSGSILNTFVTFSFHPFELYHFYYIYTIILSISHLFLAVIQ